MKQVDFRSWASRRTSVVILVAVLARADIADAQGTSSQASVDPLHLSASNLTPSPPVGLLPEPRILTEGINFAVGLMGEGPRVDGQLIKQGWYPELSNMITGAGFVSIGPGYRWLRFDGEAVVDVSSAVSWHFYKMAQARLEFFDLADGRVVAGGQLMWQDQTQIKYFGVGPDSVEADKSQYRMTYATAVSYVSTYPASWLEIGGEFAYLNSPDIREAAGTFKPDLPDTSQQFPNDPAVSLSSQPDFLRSEAFIAADTRDHRSYTTSGLYYRAAVTSFKDMSDSPFSFLQYEAEATHFIPVTHRNWILALRGWIVGSDVPAGNDVPFYMLPSLGGHNTLRGFANYRFHDRYLLSANAESRFAIFEHLDAALFVDAGNVAPRVADLNLNKVDVGAGLQLHTPRATFLRFDFAYGNEGWKFFLRTSDPIRLSRPVRRSAVIPFAP
jgi:hypothetical protein